MTDVSAVQAWTGLLQVILLFFGMGWLDYLLHRPELLVRLMLVICLLYRPELITKPRSKPRRRSKPSASK
jgi:hypothetical protein